MTIRNKKDKAAPMPTGFDFVRVISQEAGFALLLVSEEKDEAVWVKITNPVVRIKEQTFLVLNTKQEALPVPSHKAMMTSLKTEGKYVLASADYHPAGTARWYLLKAS